VVITQGIMVDANLAIIWMFDVNAMINLMLDVNFPKSEGLM
jgi:hypothetical protein